MGTTSNPTEEIVEKVLSSLSSVLVQRLALSSSGFNSQYNGLRNLNLILGYDETIDISQYRYEYERGGIAERIVDLYPSTTWGKRFDIQDDPNLKRKSPFEKEFSRLYTSETNGGLGIHQKLLQASKLSYLYHYSIILIGAPGDPETELPKKRGAKGVAYLLPLGEDKVKIAEVVGQNPGDRESYYDPRYGLPKYYEINLNGIGPGGSVSSLNSTASPSFTNRKIHWSRVIHIVRSPLDNPIIGRPILRSVWNYLSDLKKIVGGGSEASLRRGWPGLHANVDADVKLEPKEKDAIRSQVEEYLIGLTNGILTRKVDISEIATKGSIDIRSNAESVIQQICGTIGAPWRLFIGGELGKANAEQDEGSFQRKIMELRATENDPIVRQLNRRLIDYGYLPPPKNPDYQVIFGEEEELDEEGKARTAKLMKEGDTLTQDERRDRLYGLPPLGKEVVKDNKEGEGEPDTKGTEEETSTEIVVNSLSSSPSLSPSSSIPSLELIS